MGNCQSHKGTEIEISTLPYTIGAWTKDLSPEHRCLIQNLITVIRNNQHIISQGPHNKYYEELMALHTTFLNYLDDRTIHYNRALRGGNFKNENYYQSGLYPLIHGPLVLPELPSPPSD